MLVCSRELGSMLLTITDFYRKCTYTKTWRTFPNNTQMMYALNHLQSRTLTACHIQLVRIIIMYRNTAFTL